MKNQIRFVVLVAIVALCGVYAANSASAIRVWIDNEAITQFSKYYAWDLVL